MSLRAKEVGQRRTEKQMRWNSHQIQRLTLKGHHAQKQKGGKWRKRGALLWCSQENETFEIRLGLGNLKEHFGW